MKRPSIALSLSLALGLSMTLGLPIASVASDRSAQMTACFVTAERTVKQSSAYRNGSIREKQALLRRADVLRAKRACAQAG